LIGLTPLLEKTSGIRSIIYLDSMNKKIQVMKEKYNFEEKHIKESQKKCQDN
jgi:hypothetical protein